MPNVKPGDLCIVVGAISHGLNGRIVEVVKKAYAGDIFLVEDGSKVRFNPPVVDVSAWEVASNDTIPWITADKISRQMLSRPLADAILFKIKDGDLTLDETSEVDKDINLTKEKETV